MFLPHLYTSLPWWETVWTCLLELREGQAGWMKSISCNQRNGDTERLLYPGAPQCPIWCQKECPLYNQRAWAACRWSPAWSSPCIPESWLPAGMVKQGSAEPILISTTETLSRPSLFLPLPACHLPASAALWLWFSFLPVCASVSGL